MRKVILTVLGIAGLSLLLCGSSELWAQTDDTTSSGNVSSGNATDSRVQGTPPGDVRVGNTGTAATGTGTGTAVSPQTVLQLQQQVAQLQTEVAQLRAQLETVTTNQGVGGSGQEGTAPSPPLRAGTAQETGVGGSGSGARGSGEAVVNAIYTGKVRSVSGGRLVLQDDEGRTFTVALGKQTRVLRDGQRIAATELNPGTRVRATVDMLSGHDQATEVITLPTP